MFRSGRRGESDYPGGSWMEAPETLAIDRRTAFNYLCCAFVKQLWKILLYTISIYVQLLGTLDNKVENAPALF